MYEANCRSCGATDLAPFLSLGTTPLADALVKEEDLAKPEARYPLDVAFCARCALVQIIEDVPPEELFCRDYPYFSSFSDELLRHSKENVQSLIEARGLGPDSLVVELASNDGYLLRYYVDRGVPVLGIDPAETQVRAALDRGVRSLCEFFTLDFAKDLLKKERAANVIHGNNVLAHVPDLNGFVAGIAVLLAEDGVAVIEVPYLKDLIDRCEFDTIYHEHHCYFSVTALDALFRRHGLWLNRVDHLPIHGGSLRLFVEKIQKPDGSTQRYLEDERREGLHELPYFQDFERRVKGIRKDLRSLLDELRGKDKTIAAYGAAAKGSTLLNYAGIGRDTLDFVVDRNVHKQGLYMPGIHLPIREPAALLEKMPDYVLILAWNFRKEIVQQQDEYRRRGGRFIVPVPEPQVL